MSKPVKLFHLMPLPLVPQRLIEIANKNQQVLLYGLIGIMALLIDLSLFYLVNSILGINALISNTVSIFTAMIISFSLNAHYNFRTTDNLTKRFIKFVAVTAVGYLASQFILYLGIELLDYGSNISKLLTLPPVFIIQYALNKRITFKSSPTHPKHGIDLGRDNFLNPTQTKKLAGKKVAVIGAGFSGMASAYELSKHGAQVTIFEQSPNIGGLVQGFTLKDGTRLEKAYHFLYRTDRYIIDLCQELKIRDKLKFYPSSLIAYYNNKSYSLVSPLDLLKFRPLSFIDRIRTGITGLRLQTIRNWRPLTKITAYEWLCRVNGKHATDIVWKPLLQGKFDIYWDKITMAWLWTRIRVRQESRSKTGKEELGYFNGGFGVVIDAIEDKLKQRNVEFKLQTKIDSITSNHQNLPIIHIAGKKYQFDAVVSAIPSHVFAKLTSTHRDSSQDYRQILTSIDYLGAVIMVFTTKKPITQAYWHQIHDAKPPFLVLLSLDSLTGTDVTNGNHIYYIGDYCTHDSQLFNLPEEQIKSKWIAGLKQLFPDLKKSDISEQYLFKFANAQHIVGTDYEAKLPSYRTPLNRIYLANFSQIFPEDRGTNYAVRDGIDVAHMVIEDLT